MQYSFGKQHKMYLLKTYNKGVYNLLFSGTCSFFSVAPGVQKKCVGRYKEDWRSHQMGKPGKITSADEKFPIPPMLHTTYLRPPMRLGKDQEKHESSCADRWPKS